MKENPKITYFLGAGASYNAVPIINELQIQFGQFVETILAYSIYDKDFRNEIDEYIKYTNRKIKAVVSDGTISRFFYDLAKLSERSKKYATIDTYALYNEHHNRLEYNRLKHTLNLFFTIWQTGEIKDKDNRIIWDEIDSRYIGLLSAIFRKESGIVISDNIDFITWNYDTQLEKAIQLFTENGTDLLEVCKITKVYPVFGDDKCKIVHLNGISGFYKNNNEPAQCIPYNSSQDILKSTIDLANLYFKKTHLDSDTTLMQFSWDTAIESNEAIRRSKEILMKSDYLVVIGYSFPLFNRVADITMFKSLNRKCKIIIQNPGLTKEMFLEYFGDMFKNHDIIVKDSSQFFVPSEYFTDLPSSYGKYPIS